MAGAPLSHVLRHVRALVGPPCGEPSDRLLLERFTRSRAQAAFVSQALMPTFAKAMAKARHEIHFILVSRPEGELPPGASRLRETIFTFAPDTPCAPTAPEDIAFWLHSSGSTGRPKGTVHTHANPYWTAELYGIGVLGITERDLCYSAAKLFFAYGLGNALTFPLSAGL